MIVNTLKFSTKKGNECVANAWSIFFGLSKATRAYRLSRGGYNFAGECRIVEKYSDFTLYEFCYDPLQNIGPDRFESLLRWYDFDTKNLMIVFSAHLTPYMCDDKDGIHSHCVILILNKLHKFVWVLDPNADRLSGASVQVFFKRLKDAGLHLRALYLLMRKDGLTPLFDTESFPHLWHIK